MSSRERTIRLGTPSASVDNRELTIFYVALLQRLWPFPGWGRSAPLTPTGWGQSTKLNLIVQRRMHFVNVFFLLRRNLLRTEAHREGPHQHPGQQEWTEHQVFEKRQWRPPLPHCQVGPATFTSNAASGLGPGVALPLLCEPAASQSASPRFSYPGARVRALNFYGFSVGSDHLRTVFEFAGKRSRNIFT